MVVIMRAYVVDRRVKRVLESREYTRGDSKSRRDQSGSASNNSTNLILRDITKLTIIMVYRSQRERKGESAYNKGGTMDGDLRGAGI